MKKNYLINISYLSVIILIFMVFKTLGFSSAAMLRQDIIFYLAYIPVTSILMIFGTFYVIFSTKWKEGIKKNITSVYSIIITLFLYFLSIFLSDFYDTFASGAQWLTFVLILLFILITIPFVHMDAIKLKLKK